MFFNDTPTTEIYTLSLHEALPIWLRQVHAAAGAGPAAAADRGRGAARRPGDHLDADPRGRQGAGPAADRKSTRLNSSHGNISYAVFCLKKISYAVFCFHKTMRPYK